MELFVAILSVPPKSKCSQVLMKEVFLHKRTTSLHKGCCHLMQKLFLQGHLPSICLFNLELASPLWLITVAKDCCFKNISYNPLHFWFPTSGSQNSERINFCVLKHAPPPPKKYLTFTSTSLNLPIVYYGTCIPITVLFLSVSLCLCLSLIFIMSPWSYTPFRLTPGKYAGGDLNSP
jgi:hypothetical protein